MHVSGRQLELAARASGYQLAASLHLLWEGVEVYAVAHLVCEYALPGVGCS